MKGWHVAACAACLCCLVLVLALPAATFAQGSATIQLPNPIGITDPRVLIGRIIGAALGIIGSIAFVIFLWGGFLWMTSAGNPEKVTKGKNVILWAAIGLAVIFTSYALVTFVLKGLKTTGGAGQTGQGPGQVGAGKGQAGQGP